MARRRRGSRQNETSDNTPEGQLKAWQDYKAKNALNRPDGEISKASKYLLDRWQGEPYGDEKEGLSRAVTREVFESLEWAMPELMRSFFGGDRVVSFDPVFPTDEDQATLESEVVHKIVLETSENYVALRNSVADALLYPNSYLSVEWDDEPRTEMREFEDITEEQLALLMESDEIDEVVTTNVEEVSTGILGPDNEEVVEMRISGEARIILDEGRVCLDDVPPEECLVDNRHLTLSLEGCRYLEWRAQTTVSDLVEMGVPRDIAENAATENVPWGDEKVNREDTQDEKSAHETDKGAQRWVIARYIWQRYDYDDDGISEPRKVLRVGHYIHENEEDDYLPIVAFTTRPNPHRHVGNSMAQSVVSYQDQNTSYQRGMNDNLYRTNYGRKYIRQTVDLDAMMNYVPFGVVPMEDPSRDVVQEQTPPVLNQVLPALAHNRERVEAVSGSNAGAAGLNPDVLTKTPMGSFFAALQNSNRRLEMIVRDMLEMSFKMVFLKVHESLRRNGKPFDYKVRGQWVKVDPRQWRPRKDCSIHAGLGTGNHQERLAANDIILDMQMKALQMGMTDINKIYRTIEEKLQLLGKRDASKYFHDPSTPEGKKAMQQRMQQMQMEQQQQSDLAQAAQNETQRLAVKDQNEQNIKLLELEQKGQTEHRKLDLEEEKLEREYSFDSPKHGWGRTTNESKTIN